MTAPSIPPWEDEPAASPAVAVPPAVLRGRGDIRRRAEPDAAPVDEDAADDDDLYDPYDREVEPPRAPYVGQPAGYRGEPVVAGRSGEPTIAWNPGRQRDDVRDAERDDEYEAEDELDQDSGREPVLGETRTRYSSATDVGRAPPEFLDQDRQERHGLWRKLWGYACLIGLIALGLQLLYVYRTDIANSVPAVRPALEAVCKPLGCTVGYARRLERIGISSSSLQPPTGAAAIDDGRSRLVLNVMMHNRYDKPQHWPALVLDLTDLSDTVVVRKVLMPENYLTPQQLSGPFGPNGELKISVPIEVTGVQVNGYQLDKFFP
ncbi:MJ0042 family finger-like domain-containing protein [Achromobacter arsenitoxydans SY8]|uniref:MJ0042 family finger-like domain-containing protein n=1 Tax=Achromobacter arsenitoxydans SY8 TaxID=477184 RepID=H0F2U1_9BURK|nr:MJ0042 family finger-like domain-containing protein [Achromobacter arsenitoxydans SY8]